jgi:hypothetical protein
VSTNGGMNKVNVIYIYLFKFLKLSTHLLHILSTKLKAKLQLGKAGKNNKSLGKKQMIKVDSTVIENLNGSKKWEK